MQGYGYQFWHSRHGAYQASGVFGQCCIVMPEQDAVLAITSGIDVFEVQQLLDIVWETLLPAFELEQPAADAVIQDALAEKLSTLTLLPVSSPLTSPRLPPSTGRIYEVDANELNIKTIAIDFAQSMAIVTFRTSNSETILDCGYGDWRHGWTDLFRGNWLPDTPTPVVVSGGWASEDSFKMVIRLIESPFFYTLAFHFVGEEMLLEMQINVTMDVPKPLLLTAHRSLSVVQGSA